jgi:hypothetical protein
MAQRYDSHYLQLLTNEELDAIGDGLEQADWDMVADHGLVGITLGGAVVEHSPTADLTVDVPSLTAYNADGARIRVPSTQRVDLSVDHNSVSTAVAVPGNEKVLSLFAFFERSLSDPRIDGNSVTVYWNRAESFAFKVVQGAESGVPATPPALEADKILLADIKRENPQTQIENDDITLPGGSWVPTGGNRRQDAFVLSSGSLSARAGTAEESDQALLDIIEPLTAASGIAVAASGAWHDTTPNAAGTLQARIDKIISDLAGETTGTAAAGGAGMIGHFALPDWSGGSRARPAQSIVATLVTIQQDLEATNGGDDGALRIGSEARTGTSVSLAQGTVAEQLQEVIDELGGLTTANTWSAANSFSVVNLNGTTSIANGVTLRANSGGIIQALSGSFLNVDSGATLDLKAGSTPTVSAILDMSGADAGISYRPGTLVNADANLDVGTDRYRFTASPTVPRTYTLLDSTGNTPVDGQEIEVTMTISSVLADAIFVRETGAVEIARIVGSGNGGTLKFTYFSAGNGWYVTGNGGDGQITLHT